MANDQDQKDLSILFEHGPMALMESLYGGPMMRQMGLILLLAIAIAMTTWSSPLLFS